MIGILILKGENMVTRYNRLLGLFVVMVCIIGLTGCTSSSGTREEKEYGTRENGTDAGLQVEDNGSSTLASVDLEEKDTWVELDIEDYYITNTGNPDNLYHIDENNVLWGCGRNDYGQLGQDTQDWDTHEDMVKIAENVVHVDFSQTGFTIYLTEDHKLYGMGNAGCGALQQYETFDEMRYSNGHIDVITMPCLLMENVIYARCGRSDVACLTEDSEVWVFGTIGFNTAKICYSRYPVKVLEDAVLVTGGFFNHAALCHDGSVWTWGYNYSGNCGVEGGGIVSSPVKVAEQVSMVWTGSTTYNVDCQNISDFHGEFERQMENTLLLTMDGEFLICGVNVGTEEHTLPFYYEVHDYSVVCTHEFLPYENEEHIQKILSGMAGGEKGGNEAADAGEMTLADKVLSFTQSPPESLYFLMATEISYEGKMVRIDEEDTGRLLHLLQDIAFEEIEAKDRGELLYILLLYDENRLPVCRIDVYDNCIGFDFKSYYEISKSELQNSLAELYNISEELEKLSPEECLLSTSLSKDDFAQEDIFLHQEKPALMIETGYDEIPYLPYECYYESILWWDSMFFDARYQTTYAFALDTAYYDAEGNYVDGDTRITFYYDYFTGEQVAVQ